MKYFDFFVLYGKTHISDLFQFDCTNTLNDQILENVRVDMEPSDGEFEVAHYIPCPSLPYNQPGTTYTLIKLPDDASSGTHVYQRKSYDTKHYCRVLNSTNGPRTTVISAWPCCIT